MGIPTIAGVGALEAVLGSNGGTGSAPSDQQIQQGYQVIVDYINSHGGLLGHKIVPIFAKVDATQSAATNDQTMCTDWTQDHHVFAGLGEDAGTDLIACMQAAGALVVDQGGFVNYDDVAFGQYPLYMTAGALSLTRVAEVEANGLFAEGFFSPGAKVGLFGDNSPPYLRAVDVLKMTLAKHGIRLTDEQLVQPTEGVSDVGPVQEQISNATLRFHAEGIDHVIFLDNNGDTQSPFDNAAQSQGYYPRQGFTSNETPANHANRSFNSNANTIFANAIGIGWDPTHDLPSAPPDGTAQLCNKLEASVGFSATVSQQLYWTACDQLLILAAAVNAAGQLSPGPTVNSLGRVTNFTPAELLGPVDYSGNRRDGAAVGRYFAYHNDCGCMVYTSGDLALSSLESG